MATILDITRYLLRLAAADEECEPITPMRLYKLLYYCQGWHLAWYGTPLFEDRIEAWRHGPVVPSLYDLFKGREPIPDDGTPDALSPAQHDVIAHVWSHYGKFSAYGLRDLTHNEAPYKDHYRPDAAGRCDEEIPVADMHRFFKDEYVRQTGEVPDYDRAADGQASVLSVDQLKSVLGW